MKRSGNEREGKLAGRRAAAGASIIGPARNASSPQKDYGFTKDFRWLSVALLELYAYP